MSVRIAIVGAATDCGHRLRDALAAAGVPGSRVDLYGTNRGEMVLGEYDGEARVVQEIDWVEILDHEVIYLCQAGGDPLGEVRTSTPGRLVIDLAREGEAPLLDPVECEPGPVDGYHAVPHEISTLLTELLRPLERGWGIRRAQAFVLRPAADFGQPGVDELRDQVVKLLNFGEAPREVFGRQLAFNLLPSVPADGESDLERRIVQEVGKFLGWTDRKIALALLVAPMFFGHGVQLHLQLSRPAEVSALREAFVEAGLTRADDGENATGTPLDVAADRTTCVVEIREDGIDGFWLWTVAGENHRRGVDLAVEATAALLRA